MILCYDLVTLIFDLSILTLFRIQCLTCPIYIPILIILQLLVTELWITEFDHMGEQSLCNVHVPHHVTFTWGDNWSTF